MTGKRLGVIGGGAWGTALAQAMAAAGRPTVLWARNADAVSEIGARRTNEAYLPGVTLDPRLQATTDLAAAATADIILLVIPAQQVRAVVSVMAPLLRPGTPVVICSKGLEAGTRKRLSEVIAEVAPQVATAVLSGPSFAAEVVRGLPVAVTIASRNEAVGRALATAIGTRTFRPYWTDDLVGVELCGAVKNVLAIAAGIVSGRALGASAHAGLVTRGFAELSRLLAALGARPETPLGLSGLGDLILTCNSMTSRNMSLGHALGRGETLSSILGSRRAVSEGVTTAASVVGLAKEQGVEMPIANAVHGIVAGALTVDAAIEGLLARPFRAEG